jgi:hemolysin activation/secretion protein
LRYGAAYLHQLPGGWQGRAQFNGQYTGNALLPGEQFGLGGPDSVRGYVLREAVNDRGYSGQLELYTPDLAQKFGLTTDYRPRLVAFYDFGTIARNHALPGESQGDSIASAGVGLRVTRGTTFSLRMDFARILETTSNRDAGSLRMGATLAYSF